MKPAIKDIAFAPQLHARQRHYHQAGAARLCMADGAANLSSMEMFKKAE